MSVCFVISAQNKCFGGVARLKAAVDDIKNEHENVIFLNAGDFYQGTIWYTNFKWQVVAQFANILNFTAMVNNFLISILSLLKILKILQKVLLSLE